MDPTELDPENAYDDEEEADWGEYEDESLAEDVVMEFVNETELQAARERAAMDISLEKRKKRWMDYKSKGKLDHMLKEMEKIVSDTFKDFFPSMTTRNFRTKIGMSVQTIARVMVRYHDDFQKHDLDLVDLLVTMNWFKENPTYDSLALNWRMDSRSACHKLVSDTCCKLYMVLDEIAWNRNEAWNEEEVVAPPGHPLEGVTFSIDGTECGIAKPVDKEEENVWFSQKAGKHTAKYELCTHISSGRIMWMSGGIPGSIHDSKLCNSSGVLDAIPDGQKGLADKGYQGIDKTKLLVMLKLKKGENSLLWDEHLYNKVLSALRIEVERVNGRLKNFDVLWRCRTRNRLHHEIVFRILCNLVNIQSEVHPLRRAIHPILLDANFIIPTRALP